MMKDLSPKALITIDQACRMADPGTRPTIDFNVARMVSYTKTPSYNFMARIYVRFRYNFKTIGFRIASPHGKDEADVTQRSQALQAQAEAVIVERFAQFARQEG